jgi:hypothetical protein
MTQVRDPRYPHPGLFARTKGQRYDPPLLGQFNSLEADGTVVGGDVCGPQSFIGMGKVVGEFDGFDGFGSPTRYEAIQVTRADGVVVPAFRIKAEGTQYNICQCYTVKAYRP